jgi:hypothetical protein
VSVELLGKAAAAIGATAASVVDLSAE